MIKYLKVTLSVYIVTVIVSFVSSGMDYIKSYKSFINSHYVYGGIRNTVGILLPAFVMSYFNKLPTGIIISVGALCVSVTDNPGPIHHRRMGMMVCNAAILLVSLVMGFALHSPLLLGIFLFVFSFFFSMLGVYGMRAGSIGIAALLVMILNMNQPRHGWEIIWNALYTLAGGVWYMLFSLLMYSVRPYKLVQQALGDCILSIADYLRTRAHFYDREVNYDATYRILMQKQTAVQEQQNLVSEMLFKTRGIVQESTNTGRVLVMLYLDAADLFERVMTSYQDYATLHRTFDATAILQQFKMLALDLAMELDNIGIAVQSGKHSEKNADVEENLIKVRGEYNQLKKTFLTPDNLEGFIGLRGILDNIQDVYDRINTLHHYTTYDRKLRKQQAHKIDYSKFISHQEITPQVFFDNLSFESNTFRHSLRVSLAVTAGYLISWVFPLGHSYWILLTIVVILKPAYSLSKKRNTDRLIGTVLGVLAGIVILHFVKNGTALLIIMIVLMAISYSFLRKTYFIGVLFMTPYVILFSHLLNPGNFTAVLTDRVVDTVIGSVIAFVASIFLVPAWEHTTIKTYMIAMLEDNSYYFSIISMAFSADQPVVTNQHQIARKNAYVALANLSDAFNRMLSEPKWKQKGIDHVHQFVVLNHMLASHIATLSYYTQSKETLYRSGEFKTVSADILQYLTNTIILLEDGTAKTKTIPRKESLRLLNEQTNVLLEKRKTELQQGQWETTTKKSLRELKSVVDQFNFIYKIVVDLNKISTPLIPL